MEAATTLDYANPKGDKAIIRIKHKICSRQREFELLNVSFFRFLLIRNHWDRLEFNVLSIQVIDTA